MDGGQEISCGFVVAAGDDIELFEFADKIFDEVAPLVDPAQERQFAEATGAQDRRCLTRCNGLWRDPTGARAATPADINLSSALAAVKIDYRVVDRRGHAFIPSGRGPSTTKR